MALIGSGERALILSDQVSTSSPIGLDQETPLSGRILIFLDSTPTHGLWSKDESGAVKPLNGGTMSDLSWEAVTPFASPTPAGDITHSGRVAVGLDPLLLVPIPAGIEFQVVGSESLEGSIFFLEGTVAGDQVSHNQVFASTTDKGLYAKPEGLPERRIDAPGLIRKKIPAGEQIIAPDGSQYLVFGSFTLEAGAVLTLLGDADLVVL
jgi:hypothetical protein